MFPIGDFPDRAAEIAAEQLVRCYDRKLRPFATCSSILLTEVVSETCSIQNCLRRKFCVGLYPKQKVLFSVFYAPPHVASHVLFEPLSFLKTTCVFEQLDCCAKRK